MFNRKNNNDLLLYYDDMYSINSKNTELVEMLKSCERARMFLLNI